MSTSSEKFLPVSQPDLSGREGDYLLEAFRSGWISSIGSYINKFERAAADAFECEHAVCVSNGTVALHLALRALDITPGDEVVVPALTFVATAAVVIHAGATPVFVDCDPEIGTLCPEAFARAVGPRTKAVIPVHLYGHPVDMDPVLDIAKSAKIAVIEDAAEAHGARYKRRFVGSMGTVGAFSFYANKIVTTGEGGLLTTSDARLAERLRLLRDHAMDPNRKYWHTEPGFNYRMTNLQAAIGCAQFERLNELISKRQDIAEQYRSRLSHLHGMRVNPSKPWAQPVISLNRVLRVKHAIPSSGRCTPDKSTPGRSSTLFRTFHLT